MNRYFIVDLQSDYKSFTDFEDLKELLVENVIRDTKENIKDENIVLNNLEHLEKLTDIHISLSYLIDNLESFGYKIIDLLQLQKDLEDIKQFIGNDSDFNKVISLINEER